MINQRNKQDLRVTCLCFTLYACLIILFITHNKKNIEDLFKCINQFTAKTCIRQFYRVLLFVILTYLSSNKIRKDGNKII